MYLGGETEIIFCKVKDLLDEGEQVLQCLLCKTCKLSSATGMHVLENNAGNSNVNTTLSKVL